MLSRWRNHCNRERGRLNSLSMRWDSVFLDFAGVRVPLTASCSLASFVFPLSRGRVPLFLPRVALCGR